MKQERHKYLTMPPSLLKYNQMSVLTNFQSIKKCLTSDSEFPTVVSKAKPSSKRLYYYEKVPKSITHELSNEEFKVLGYITYRVLDDKTTLSHYDDDWKNSYIPMSSSFLRDIIGGNYTKTIKRLVSLGIIEVFATADGIEYSAMAKKCKAYRYTKTYINDIRTGNFNKRLNNVVKVKFNNTVKETLELGSLPEEEEVVDPIIESVLQSYKDLTLSDEWQESLWSIDRLIDATTDKGDEVNLLSDRQFALQIGRGMLNISRSKSGRVYHPTILMRKELRPFLRYNGNKLVEVDVKAAHPCLMGKFADIEDRERWLDVCKSGEIYKRFEDDKFTRILVKKQFQQAISYMPTGRSKKSQEILDYIQHEFPSIYNWLSSCWKNQSVKKDGNSPQFILQSLESKIFIDQTFKKLYGKVWLLPQHDGFLIEQKDSQIVARKLNESALKELGFELTIV